MEAPAAAGDAAPSAKKRHRQREEDPNKQKRKKVSKACIFCKRSHMTCTENRPCDRCVKRDIAHLCQDFPVKNESVGPEDADDTETKVKLEGSSDEGGLDQRQSVGDATSAQILKLAEAASRPSTAPSHTALHSGQQPQPTQPSMQTSPQSSLFDSPGSAASALPQQDYLTTNATSSLSTSQPRTAQPSNSHRAYSSLSASPGWPTASLGALAGPSSSDSELRKRDRRFQQNPSPLGANPSIASQNQAEQPLHASNPPATSHRESPNPFAILNQAYDFSYPSQTGANSLASLRLFATTTADPPLDAFNGLFGSQDVSQPLGSDGQGFQAHHAMSNAPFSQMNSRFHQQSGPSEASGSDIDSAALDDFLRTLDEMYLNPMPEVPQNAPARTEALTTTAANSPEAQNGVITSVNMDMSRSGSTGNENLIGTHTPSSSTERFLLTAADQKDGTKEERLNKVIRAKYEAGLLKPFNFIKGYERLNTWMDSKWSPQSKHRALRIISAFRPAFRTVATTLTDMDLIWIEESFERLLLDYDRVFTTMGIPACLWRRTGEIFKGNREFADLVGIPYEQMRDGKLAIYELMAEDSAVNFWEKYGSIAFDPGQKAVLTSCILIDQAKLAEHRAGQRKQISHRNSLSSQRKSFGNGEALSIDTPADAVPKSAYITCTFSFTIRRDAYHIPNAIVGNFMAYTPQQ